MKRSIAHKHKHTHTTLRASQEFYHWRREVVGACRPSAAHYAVAAFQKRCLREGRQCDVLTQNIDGLHQVRG